MQETEKMKQRPSGLSYVIAILQKPQVQMASLRWRNGGEGVVVSRVVVRETPETLFLTPPINVKCAWWGSDGRQQRGRKG